MINTVLFDLDGTLLNTLEDLTDSVNHVLETHDMPARSIDEVRQFVGNGLKKTMERAAPDGSDSATIESLYRDMVSWYRDHCEIKTAPYDGINDLLKRLKKKGFELGVVTNKDEPAAKELCEAMFAVPFDVIIGDDGVSPKKPDPAGVRRAMKYLGRTESQCVFVGDSDVDIKTAVNAGLKSIGVLWGFRDEKTILGAGADFIADTPEKTESVIEKLNLR